MAIVLLSLHVNKEILILNGIDDDYVDDHDDDVTTTTTISLLPLVNCTCRKRNVDKATRRWKKQNGSDDC